MNDIRKIVSLLEDLAVEKQIAAAIVLGELGAKGQGVEDALAKLLSDARPLLLQRHALDALAKIGAKRSLKLILPLVVSSDADVRQAALRAIASAGEAAIAPIRHRLPLAEPEERRTLESLLADAGESETLFQLLESAASGDAEKAKAAMLMLRQRTKSATAGRRRGYLAETERFLKSQQKLGGAPSAILAGVKVLGYLEHEKALPTLLAFATSPSELSAVRHEAFIGIRFAIANANANANAGRKRAPFDGAKIARAAIDAAAGADRALAQAALKTLGALALSPDQARRLEKLVEHPDHERARLVIEQLGRQKGADAAKVLVDLLVRGDKRRAEYAAAALAAHDDATSPLAHALLTADNDARAQMIRVALRPNAKKIAPALKKRIVDLAIQRLEAGEHGWEALFDAARDADPEAIALALRALTTKLRRADRREKALSILSMLCRSERASDDDRYLCVALELAKKGHDTRRAARAGDAALQMIGALLDRGYDVSKALRTDRNLGLEDLYYVGFHFAEEGHPVGEELLGEVAKRGGRAKIGRMAKNKLALGAGG